jgi:hypothetical protein
VATSSMSVVKDTKKMVQMQLRFVFLFVIVCVFTIGQFSSN